MIGFLLVPKQESDDDLLPNIVLLHLAIIFIVGVVDLGRACSQLVFLSFFKLCTCNLFSL